MLALRLRPPPRFFPSRAYSSPSFLQKPHLARPYLWWLKARYRKDGTRRSIILGIIHGACYVGVTVYAYHQYHARRDQELFIKKLSGTTELQRINRKYRNSSFTKPAEIKAYITDIAKVELIPGMSKTLSLFCDQYEALSEDVPENHEKIRERICELYEVLALGPNFIRRFNFRDSSFFADFVMEVQEAYEKLALVLAETLSIHSKKRMEKPQEMVERK